MQTLIPAQRQDKARVIDILSQAFDQDPQISWYVGNGPDRNRRMRTLMEFSFEEGMARNSVFLSPDKNGVSIWRKDGKPGFSLHFMWMFLKFMWVFGLKKVQAITRLENNIHTRYPRSDRFWYLWLLAVAPEGQGKGISTQLLRPHLDAANEESLPVYLETSTSKNMAIYRRKGFELYDQMPIDEKTGTQIYFMRRPAVSVVSSMA